MTPEQCFRYADFARRLIWVSPASGKRTFVQVSAEFWQKYGPESGATYSFVDESGRYVSTPTADEIREYALGRADFIPFPDPFEYVLDIVRRFSPPRPNDQMRQLRQQRWEF